MNALLLAAVVALEDPVPAADDVKAGWGALFLFLGLMAAVAFLVWSMSRHLKKSKTNADAGAFGDSPEDVGSRDVGRQD